MTDDLRTRIAAALWDGYTYDPCEDPDTWALRMADAVIRELGLRREKMPKKRVLSYRNEPWFDMPAAYRYVTEWETGNE